MLEVKFGDRVVECGYELRNIFGGFMTGMGIVCSTSSFLYVLLKGKKDDADLVVHAELKFPKSYSRSEQLKWFYVEILEILRKYKVTGVTIKSTEPMGRRGKSFGTRSENEAIVQLAAAEVGIRNVYKKVKMTIAKELTGKGKAGYLDTKIDLEEHRDIQSLPDKYKPAIYSALSAL